MARCQFLQSIRRIFREVFCPKKESTKVKPLELYRKCLIWLSIHPPYESAGKHQKFAYVTFTGTVLKLLLCALSGNLVFCYEFWSINLERCMLALMVIGLSFGSTYMLIITIATKRHKVGAIFEDLSTIYDTYENEESFCFLVKTKKLCAWMLQAYLKIVIGAIVGTAVASLVSVVYCWWMNEHLNVEDLLHVAPIVLPWNQTTLLGYVSEVNFMLLCCICYHIVTATFLLLFISMSLHHHAFHEMFKHSIDKLHLSEANWDAKFLCDRVRFQISVKNWFLDSAEFYSPSVMVQMICNGAIMAICAFNLDMQFEDINFDLVVAIFSLLFGSSNALLFCYFGKFATESYEKMHGRLFKLKWYKLPIESQKYVILMGANMQRPLFYHGFGVFYLNLETFTQMLRSVFSYYTAIKTITSK